MSDIGGGTRTRLASIIRNLSMRTSIERLSRDPLCKSPRATREGYLAIFEEARTKDYPQIDALEDQFGFHIDKAWLDDLALHTQIVVKESDICYQHGRVLYSALRHRLDNIEQPEFVRCFETGTARGFSALCMAKALADHHHLGEVITIDVLPHRTPIYWNCIDDLEGKKSRQDLLKPWSELRRNILFIQSDTRLAIQRLSCDRIHFAFLDAGHTYDHVMGEFEFVSARQKENDIIVFDDVTEAMFPGIVAAINEISQSQKGRYDLELIEISKQRGYAVAKRLA